jgi:hypothetical protein
MTTACNTVVCNPCTGETCSGHGTCDNTSSGDCTCSDGFGGLVCDAPPSCAGVLDKDFACCLGVLTPGGECCAPAAGATATIAADGSCCASGATDVCGVCGGSTTAVDAVGTCCSGAIGEDGLCCASGAFDTCGVCDGDDSSCNVAANMVVAPPPGETADSVLADATKLQDFKDSFKAGLVLALSVPADSLSITGVAKQGRRRLGTERHRRLSATLSASFELEQNQVKTASASAPPVSALQVMDSLATAAAGGGAGVLAGAIVGSVAAKAVCGNGVCEEGERCTNIACTTPGCKGDCPYFVHTCPGPSYAGGGECSGHGRCLSSSGACACFQNLGYVGAACDECKAPFLLDAASHKCVRQLSALEWDSRPTTAPTPAPTTAPTPAPTPTPTPAPTPAPTDEPAPAPASASGAGLVVGVAAAGVLLLAGALFARAKKRRSARDAKLTDTKTPAPAAAVELAVVTQHASAVC